MGTGGESMHFEIIDKPSFCVIGKEGSTLMGAGFVQKLWADANTHFNEISNLAKRDKNGNLLGCWGCMSDLTRTFKPWEEDFSKGLYLAGVECKDDALAPDLWTKWKIPAFRYLRIRQEGEYAFQEGLTLLSENGYALVAAAQDFTDPNTGVSYIYYPIEKL